jgi:hypothetical protein
MNSPIHNHIRPELPTSKTIFFGLFVNSSMSHVQSQFWTITFSTITQDLFHPITFSHSDDIIIIEYINTHIFSILHITILLYN